MLKIAICDDDKIICEEIKQSITESLIERNIESAIDIYNDGSLLFQALNDDRIYDLIFLDIIINKSNGIKIANYIRDKLDQQLTSIVFISSHKTFALQLFESRPLDFLIKPLDYLTIKKVIKKYLHLNPIENQVFQYKIHSTVFVENMKNIIYIESNGKRIHMHLIDGEIITFYDKLNNIYHDYRHSFMRVHQSHIINPMYVKSFSSHSVTLINNVCLKVSIPYRNDIKKELIKQIGVVKQ